VDIHSRSPLDIVSTTGEDVDEHESVALPNAGLPGIV
jgi:hypothetical protein